MEEEEYLLNGSVYTYKELEPYAKKNNVDFNTYVKTVGAVKQSLDYSLNGSNYSKATIEQYAKKNNVSFDEYVNSVGVKKKNYSQSTSQNPKLASGTTNGSSVGLDANGFQKIQISPLIDGLGDSEITKLKKKIDVKVTPENMEQVSADTDALAKLQKANTPNALSIETQKKLNKDKNFVKDYKKFKQTTSTVTQKDIERADSELNDELNDNQWTDYLREGARNTFAPLVNTVADIAMRWDENAPKTEIISEKPKTLLEESLQKADDYFNQTKKDAVKMGKPIPTYTKEQRLEKAKEIFRKEKIDSYIYSRQKDYLQEQDDADWGVLQRKFADFKKGELASLDEKEKTILNIQNIQLVTSERLKKEIESLKNKTKEGFKNPELQEKINDYNNLTSEINKNTEKFLLNRKNIGNAADNLDVLKRNYSLWSNLYGNVMSASQGLASGAISALDYGLQAKGYIQGGLNDNDTIIQGAINQASKDVKDLSEKTASEIERPMSVGNINSLSDFGDWFMNDAAVKQVPIYGIIMTGGLGVAGIGVTSLGTKYSDMQEEMDKGLKFYTPEQQLLHPLGYGIAETASAAVDLMVLKNAGRVLASATAPEREMIAKGMLNRAKKISTEYLEEAIKGGVAETLDETATQGIENIIDGKSFTEGMVDAGAAGGAMGFLIPFAVSNYKQILKPFTSDTKIQEESAKVLKFQQQLDNPNIAPDIKLIIQENLNKSKEKANKLAIKIIKDVKNLPNNEFKEIVALEKTQANINSQAEKIKFDDNLDIETKKQILSNLKEEFKANEIRRLQILDNASNNRLNRLKSEEAIRLKNKAGKELMKEQNPDGKQNIIINDKEISDRAVEILDNEKPLSSQKEAKKMESKVITVYHGGNLDGKGNFEEGNFYAAKDKKQAEEYAKGNGGKLYEYDVDESKLANEEEAREVLASLNIQAKGEDTDNLLLHEVLDDRFDTSINKEDFDKLRKELEKRGYQGISFTDEDITQRNKMGSENVVVFDPKSLQKKSGSDLTEKKSADNKTNITKESEQKNIISLGTELMDAVRTADFKLRADGKGSKEIARINLETLSTKEENTLYNENKEYKELYDKSEEGTLTEQEDERLSEIYVAERTKKQVKLLGELYQREKEKGDSSVFVDAVDKLLQENAQKQIENEATPQTNSPTNGNPRIEPTNVGESGNSVPKSDIQKDVPSSVDGGEGKGYASVGKIIEPHSEVNTDVETVKKELKLNDVESLIYDGFKDIPRDKIIDKVDDVVEKWKDDKYGEIEAIEGKINDIDIKLEDNGIEIDQINDAENMTAAKKKKAVAEKEKEYEDLQKQQKELEEQKEAVNESLKQIDDVLFHPTEDYNVDLINEVVDKVNNRLETRKSIKEGTNLFPEDANIPEFVAIKKELIKLTDEKTIADFNSRTAEQIKESEPIVADIKSKAKNAERISKEELEKGIADAEKLLNDVTHIDEGNIRETPENKDVAKDYSLKKVAKTLVDAKDIDDALGKLSTQEKTDLYQEIKKQKNSDKMSKEWSDILEEETNHPSAQFLLNNIYYSFDKKGQEKLDSEGVNEGVKSNNEGVKKPPTTKEKIAERIKLSDAKVDAKAELVKAKLKAFANMFPSADINPNDYKANGYSAEAIIDMVAKAAKSLAKGGIILDTHIKEAIKAFNTHFEDEVDFDAVKQKINSETEKKEPKAVNQTISEKAKKLKISEQEYEELNDMVKDIPESGVIKDYVSGKTITRAYGTPKNAQGYDVKGDDLLRQHGIDVVEKAKKLFGEDYVAKLADYIENSNLNSLEKTIVLSTLQNIMDMRVNLEPNDVAEVELQKYINALSQEQRRIGSLTIRTGRLDAINKIIRDGVDLESLRSGLFTSKQEETKSDIDEVVANAREGMNEQDDIVENEKLDRLKYTQEDFDAELKKAIDNYANNTKEAKTAFEKLKREAFKDKIVQKKEELRDEANDLIEQLRKLARKSIGDISVNPIPIEAIPIIAKLAKVLIKEGALSMQDISSKIHNNIKDVFEGISEKDIVKALLPKGTRVLSTETKRKIYVKLLEKHIEVLDEQIYNKEKPIVNKVDNYAYDLEIQALRELKKAKQKELLEADPTYIERKKQSDYNKNLNAKINDTNKKIKDLEENIEKNNNGKSTVWNAELSKAKNDLKALRELKKAESIGEVVKQALIDAGFSREVTYKGEKVKRLDWKLLAGKKGIVETIKETLKEQGKYSEAQIEQMTDAIKEEYIKLNAKVIENGLKELERKGKITETKKIKSQARLMADFYNFGLFENNRKYYEKAINAVIGLSEVSQKAYDDIESNVKALSFLFNQKDKNGNPLGDVALESVSSQINHHIKSIVSSASTMNGGLGYRFISAMAEFTWHSLKGMLGGLNTILENMVSNKWQGNLTKWSNYKNLTPELKNQIKADKKAIYNDIVQYAGLFYGETGSSLISHTRFDDWINGKVDSKIGNTVVSWITLRKFLEAPDSAVKAQLTQIHFVTNMIDVLTLPLSKNPNGGMTKEQAQQYLNEQLTGDSFKDALATAEKIINKTNELNPKKNLKTNKEAIHRFAMGIVKQNLISAQTMSLEQMEQIFGASYKTAGLSIGHEANNFVSKTANALNALNSTNLEKSLKEGNYLQAAMHQVFSIITKGILMPFAGGGSNWTLIQLSKLGLPIEYVYDRIMKTGTELDLSTPQGRKELKNTLFRKRNVQQSAMRTAVGGLITVAAVTALTKDFGDDDEDKDLLDVLSRKLRGNDLAKKMVNRLLPSSVSFLLHLKEHSLDEYALQQLNMKTDLNDNVLKTVVGIAKGDKPMSKVGGLFGQPFSMPFGIWRTSRDIYNLGLAINGERPIKFYKKNPQTFLEGLLNGGFFQTAKKIIDNKKEKVNTEKTSKSTL